MTSTTLQETSMPGLTRPNRRGLLLVALASFALGGLLIPFFGVSVDHDLGLSELQFLVVSLGLLTLFAVWVPAIVARRREGTWFGGMGLLAIGHTVFFVIPLIYIALNPRLDASGTVGEYPVVLLLVIAATATASLGYLAGPGKALARELPALGHHWTGSDVPKTVLMGYVLGWISRGILIAWGSYWHGIVPESDVFLVHGSLLNVLVTAGQLCFVLIGVLAWQNPGSSTSRLFRLLFLAELFWALPSGRTSVVFHTVLLVVIGLCLIRGRLSVRTIVVVVLLLVTLFPFLRFYRDVLREYLGPLGTIPAVLRAASVTADRLRYSTHLVDDLVETLMIRLGEGVFLARIVRLTPSVIRYRLGRETMIGMPFFMIPRSIWPGKPYITTGGWFSATYFPDAPPGTARPSTLIGDFYLNFGLPGVLVGMLMWGILMRAVFEYCYGNLATRTPMSLALYIYLCLLFIEVAHPLAVVLITAVRQLGFAMVISWLVAREARSRSKRMATIHAKTSILDEGMDT